MDVRSFVQTLEAAQVRFLPGLDDVPARGLRQELGSELQRMEAARIAEGQDPLAARRASCQRVKVLHGLGYPVDFDWLHEPSRGARAG